MRNVIFQHEVKTWLKSPLFYVLVTSFFLFSLVSMLGTGGYFDGPVVSKEQVKLLNSPFSLCSISFLFAKFLLFPAAIFGGFSLYRDYRNKTHTILYSFPIFKSHYLEGKLGSGLFMLLIVSLLTLNGVWLGEMILGVDNPKIGTPSAMGYLIAGGVYLVPTLIVIGVVAFVAVGVSRNIFSAFIVVICFVLFQLILENLLFGHREWLALLDPFGQNAFHLATEDWDFQRQNSEALPVNLLVVGNRVFWLSIAAITYGAFYRTFDFQHDSPWHFSKTLRKEKVTSPPLESVPDIGTNIHYDFSRWARLQCLMQLIVYDFRSIIKSWMFLVLCLFGGFAVFFIQLKVTNTGAFNLLPSTRLFIGAPLSLYTLVIIFSTFLFSGLLMNKARKYQMNLMVDATPVMDWQLIGSKLGAISLIQVVQLLLFMAIGVAIQLINGYYDFDIGLYLFHLFVLVLPVLLVWNITSQFVHALFPNLFLALFLLAVLWLGGQSLDQLGIQTYVLKFNSLPSLDYSDFNGYGYQLKGYMLLLLYWLLVGGLLIVAMPIIWNRGSSSSLTERFVLAKSRLNSPVTFVLILLAVIFIWQAVEIYQLEQKDKIVKSSASFKDYKEEWTSYSRIPLPQIKDITLHIDLYPSEESFEVTGTYTLVNQSEKVIDTIFIRTGFDEVTELEWSGSAHLLKKNDPMKSYLYQLTSPLYPGDSLNLPFTIKNTSNTTFSRNSNVLKNGSYIRQDILPRLGYPFIDHELPLTDSMVNSNNYYHRDAGKVNMHTVIRTSSDQIAIAPGELISKTTVEDRNIYAYSTPKPVKLNFSFHSAKFEVLEEKYRDVTIQVLFIKGHDRNTKSMLNGLKAALDYNSKWFGPYPYKEVRIIEFPHTEGGYSATLMSNNIPVSEVLFQINNETMDDKINLPFYVLAHELTHEWFGNQVMPADAVGAKMLTESITEYITLNIYRDNLGAAMADHFLDAQYNRYHRGRKKEKGQEKPLSEVWSDQEYVAYGKGAIAFHTISKTIGKDTLHAVLKDYLSKYRSNVNFYPTTNDFIRLLKKHAGQDHFGLIDHWLRQTNDVK